MKFLLDLMCGELQSYLRMCGHDTAYAGSRDGEADDQRKSISQDEQSDREDDRLLAIASDENRTIVTRDRELAARADESILLDSTDTEAQLRSLAAVGVPLRLAEPTYCGRCNGQLVRLSGNETTPEYAPDPDNKSVWRCQDCSQCFWKGSHWNRVKSTLDRIR